MNQIRIIKHNNQNTIFEIVATCHLIYLYLFVY